MDLAEFTNGNTFVTERVREVLYWLTSLYESGLVGLYWNADCSSTPLTYYLPIDGWTQSWNLRAHGTNVNVSVWLPDGTTFVNNYYTYPIITDPTLALYQFIARAYSSP